MSKKGCAWCHAVKDLHTGIFKINGAFILLDVVYDEICSECNKKIVDSMKDSIEKNKEEKIERNRK